jgi:hypothetical protein
MNLLMQCAWPGNVRQLRNVLESAVTEAQGEEVTEYHVREVLGSADPGPLDEGQGPREDEQLRIKLLELMATHDGDATAAAATIGVSRATIYRYMHKLGVRTGRRKVWKLLDDQSASDETTKGSLVSDVSQLTEHLSRQMRLVTEENSRDALRTTS